MAEPRFQPGFNPARAVRDLVNPVWWVPLVGVRAFLGDHEPGDDVTVMAKRVLPGGA